MGQLEGAVVQDAGGVRGAAGKGAQGADLCGTHMAMSHQRKNKA
jgi:hypothetical protein